MIMFSIYIYESPSSFDRICNTTTVPCVLEAVETDLYVVNDLTSGFGGSC
jgi:hypothetical protein